MDDKVRALAEKWGVNGNLCATQNGRELFSVAHGYYDVENRLEYTEDTITYVASVTKQFTAVLIMMLYEKGLVNIDHTLDRYVPEYYLARRVTLRQLLNMTSGIPNQLSVIGEQFRKRRDEFSVSDSEFERMVSRAMAPEKCAVSDFLEIVNAEAMIFEPGEKFDYSDTNYMLLGEIAARISSVPYPELMKARIFDPLGMDSAIVGADNSAGPSYAMYDSALRNMGKAHFVTGEGSICASAKQLCVWLNAVLDGRFISAAGWDECFRLVNGYGFGWHGHGEWYCHGGGDLGYASMVWIHPGKKIAIAGAMNKNGGRFYDELFALVADELGAAH